MVHWCCCCFRNMGGINNNIWNRNVCVKLCKHDTLFIMWPTPLVGVQHLGKKLEGEEKIEKEEKGEWAVRRRGAG